MNRQTMLSFSLVLSMRSWLCSFILFAFILNANTQTPPELRLPENKLITKESNVLFQWNNNPLLSETFQFQLATNTVFTAVVSDIQTSNSYFLASGIGTTSSVYYWRVRTVNPISDWSSIDTLYYFNPGSVTGLTVWLDPTTGVVLNGTKVQQIQDQSGLSNNANQSNNAQQPLFVPVDSLINCKPSIKYDGTDDFMEMADNASLDYVDAFTAHTLVRPRVAATNKTILAKWDYQTQGAWAYQTEFAVADELMFAPCFTITDPGNQKSVTVNADMVSQKPSLLTLVYNGNIPNKVRFYKNLNPLLTSLVGTIPSSLPNCSATLKVGKYGGIATRYYDGDIVEVLIYNSDLPDSTRKKVDGYLRYKYAPSVDLGNDTLISPNGLCGNLTIKPQGKYQTYLWSTGVTTPSILVTVPGVYGVTVTDFLGNVSTDSIVVYPPYSMNYPSNNQLCEFTSNTWSPAYPSSTFSYLWQDGSTASTFTYNQPGSYHVKITDPFGCFIESDTVIITIDDYTTTAFLGVDTNLCSGNLLALQVGASETETYLWPDGSSGNQFAVDTTGNYFVESLNINGCFAQDTIHVNVVGIAPLAAYSFANVCDQIQATFTDNSQPVGASPIDAWQWDFGDGTPPVNSQSPTHVFPSHGLYEVELYVSQGGCGAYHYDTIQVYANPVVNPEFIGHCQGEEITFVDSMNLFGIGDYSWYFDYDGFPFPNQQISSSFVPIREFDSAGVFDIFCQYIDENGCLDSITVPLTVNPTPQISFTSSSACENTPISFAFTGETVPNSTFAWNFGGQATSSSDNPEHTFLSYGDYTIDLNITNPFGCSATQQEQLTIHPNPNVGMDLGPYCQGTYMSMLDTSSIAFGIITLSQWVVNQTDTLNGSEASYLIPSLGQQQIELYATSAEGCTAYLNEFIDVTNLLDVSFTTPSSVVSVGMPVTFTNTSVGTNVALWSFGDQQFSSEFDAEHTYGAEMTDSNVVVQLIGMSSNGCIDTALQNVSIEPPTIDLAITNVFLQEQSSFYTIGVRLANVGSITLNSADLVVQSESGQIFSETWNGELLPGQDSIFIFNGQFSLTDLPQNGQSPYLCVSGTGYDANGDTEGNFSNNLACSAVSDDPVILMTIYPNPVEDQMNIGLIIEQDQEIQIELFDYAGKRVMMILPKSQVSAGTSQIKVNMQRLRNGIYNIRLIGENTEIIRRIMVNQ